MFYKVTVRSETGYEETWVFDARIEEDVKYCWDRKKQLRRNPSLGKLEMSMREIREEEFFNFLRENKGDIMVRNPELAKCLNRE